MVNSNTLHPVHKKAHEELKIQNRVVANRKKLARLEKAKKALEAGQRLEANQRELLTREAEIRAALEEDKALLTMSSSMASTARKALRHRQS